MKNKRKKQNTGKTFVQEATWNATDETIGDLAEEVLKPVDEVRATPGVEGLDRFHIDNKVDELAGEQRKLWDADGEAKRREARTQADEFEKPAQSAQFLIELERGAATWAWERYKIVNEALTPYVRRGPHETTPYYIRTSLIVAGDIACVTGGMIMFGEPTWVAFLQAVSSGTAAVTGGLLAQDVKDSRLARKRQRDDDTLSKAERPYAHLFKGPDSGEHIAKHVVFGGLTIGALILGSVFTLRSGAEGTTAGISFGCLAAAVALASWANVYHYTDEVADIVWSRLHDYKKALGRLKKVSRDTHLLTRSRSLSEADSIWEEAGHRGEAAARRIQAEGHGIKHRSPGVAGHGPRATQSDGSTSTPSRGKTRRNPGDIARRSPAYDPAAHGPAGGGGHNGDGR